MTFYGLDYTTGTERTMEQPCTKPASWMTRFWRWLRQYEFWNL